MASGIKVVMAQINVTVGTYPVIRNGFWRRRAKPLIGMKLT